LAIEAGVHSTLSIPIWLSGQVAGSLNLYSTTPHAFDPRSEATADVLAAQAATTIAHHDVYRAARRLVTDAQRYADDQAGVLTEPTASAL
jgi:GAF domain-containing protein